MKISHNKTRGFTMIEIMVAVGIIVILAAILIALVGGVNDKGKATSTQAKMNILGEAVEAFKQATGKYPLAVPEDAWGVNWSQTNSFVHSQWRTDRDGWMDYFVPTGANTPTFPQWDGTTANPTNIQMLTFQLEQVPESNSILERLKQGSGQIQQMRFDNSLNTENWVKAGSDCRINTPLNSGQTRVAFQPLDAWGTPLRFWTGESLKWAKRISTVTPPPNPPAGSWQPSVQQLLSDRLQKANWGFFIESAGKDGRFGWWGQATTALGNPLNVDAQAAEDNLYKP
jgi:prepilin-type N-terminal cleavage/methylation domain-containing protein